MLFFSDQRTSLGWRVARVSETLLLGSNSTFRGGILNLVSSFMLTLSSQLVQYPHSLQPQYCNLISGTYNKKKNAGDISITLSQTKQRIWLSPCKVQLCELHVRWRQALHTHLHMTIPCIGNFSITFIRMSSGRSQIERPGTPF